VVLPQFAVFALPNADLPVMINLSIDQILKSDSAHRRGLLAETFSSFFFFFSFLSQKT